jgi:hypothetical protein
LLNTGEIGGTQMIGLGFFSLLTVLPGAATGSAEPTPSGTEPTFSTLEFAVLGILIVLGFAAVLFVRDHRRPPANKSSVATFRQMLADYPMAVVLLGALLLAIGISLTEHGWGIFRLNAEFVGHLIAEFGIALIIAYFISISIEEYARHRHNRHVEEQLASIKESVFEAVYRVRLDEKFFDFIEDALFRHPFFRKNHSVAMKIAPHDSVKGKSILIADDPVIVTITLQSTICNISTTERPKVLSTMIERSSHGGLTDEPRLCSMIIGSDRYTFLNDEDFKKLGNISITEGFKRYSVDRKIGAKDSLYVEYQYRIIKFARDEMSWRVVDPAEDFILRIAHTDQLVAFAAPMHVHREVEPRRDIVGVDLQLTISAPLFPFNGAVVWWRPTPLLLSPPRHREQEDKAHGQAEPKGQDSQQSGKTC